MEQEGGLWDDSALLNAFDNAMSTYKKVHGNRSKSKSIDDGKVGNGKWKDDEKHAAVVVDEKHAATRGADDNNHATSETASGTKEAEKLALVEENVTLACEPQPRLDTSSSPKMQAHGASPSSQSADDYNQLVGQYYELEEKRQNILQRIYQFGGYYTYPVEGSGGDWCTYTMPQDHAPAIQTSLPPSGKYSCCFSTCCCSLDRCLSACPLSGACVSKPFNDSSIAGDPGNPLIHSDEAVIKTGMGAAERAISSMKKKVSADSGLEDEHSKNADGELAQSTISETDIGAVLNAWYGAGFLTGKYLTEQSIAKKRNS